MALKYLPPFFTALVILFTACSSKSKQHLTDGDNDHMLFNRDVKEYLDRPYGTVLNLEAELVDGGTRNLKGDDGVLFLRVINVAGTPLKYPVEMRFEDETGQVSTDAFGLYRSSLIDAEIKDLDTVSELKKGSIGKKIKLVAYETGHFSGIPEKYTGCRPEKSGKPFHFEHSLVVIGCLNQDTVPKNKPRQD